MKLRIDTAMDLHALEETLDIVQHMASDVTEEDLEIIEIAISYYLNIAAENKALDQLETENDERAPPNVLQTTDWLKARPWIKWNGKSETGPMVGTIMTDTPIEYLLFVDIKLLNGVYPLPDFNTTNDFRAPSSVKDIYWGQDTPPADWQVAYYRLAK